MVRLVLTLVYQADPTTPFVGAQSAANMLGNRATLVEQLGVGHVSIVQFSPCTLGIAANFVMNSTVCSSSSHPQTRFLILAMQLPEAPNGEHVKCEIDPSNVLFPPIGNTTTKRDIGPLVRGWW